MEADNMTIAQIIIAGAAGAVLLFVLVLLVRTAWRGITAGKLSKAPQVRDEERETRYAERLSLMLQCATVSVKDSYDDTEFARLRKVVRELFPLLHEKAEYMTFSDDCWVYRLSGKDSTRNIMLMSHHDVVSQGGEWKYGAFSGEIADGRVWGRGALDTKTPLFAEMSALEELLAEDAELPCNIWLASSHNEELGGDGIPKALEYFKEKGITFELIIDEGGAVINPPLGGMKSDKCAMVAVHEKGKYYLECTASSGTGHASLTAAVSKTPLERMAAFISEITENDIFIRRLNPQMKAMFRHLGPYCGFPMNMLFANLWCFGGLLTKVMPKINPQAGGLIGTSCSFYDMNSSKFNCTATAVLRPVDGDDMQKDIESFRRTAAKYGIEVSIGENSEYHAPADMKQPGFAYTLSQMRKSFPQYPASPFILPAGTDARTLTEICPCVMRFAPIVMSAEQMSSVHSENEYVEISNLPVCVDFYKSFVRDYK